MSNEDVLFPLSPTEDGQKLRDDSMEGVATDLLLGDANTEDSLFNDSLDEDSHTATKTGITVSISSPGPEQHDLDDSLNFDTTQLPFENEPLTLSNKSDTVGDAPVESKYHSAGFELAQNISVSRPTESLHVENRESAEQSEPQSTCETGIATSSKAKTLSTASNSGGESTAAKTYKVVPSFGRRKTKAHSSPEGAKSSNEKSTADSLVPVGNQLADDRGIPNDGEGVAEEEGVREGEWKDQCVPQSSTGNTGKPQKPQFGGASKSKQPSKKPSTTRGSREERQNVTSKKKNLSTKVASSGDLNDENLTSKSESLANDNAATARESQTTAGNEQSTDRDSSSKLSSLSEKKEKKLAEQEEKKREREEKKRQAEQKKLEREQKKREAETKKAEKERLKKERQLELERRKAEKEQKKIEQALKKAERMVGKKEGKQSGTKGNKRSEQGDDTSSNTAESLPTTAQGVELADQGKEGVAEVNQLDTELETEPNQTEREENQLDPKLDPALKEKGQIHTERSKNEQTHQVQNQEVENEKVSGDGSVSGVTEPEEGASLPTDHSNVTNTLQPAFISVGYGHSPPASQEPSQSAALLPEDTADEGACYIPASVDQEGVGGGSVSPADQESRSQENCPDTSTHRGSVLKERNTAEANPQEHQEGEDKENTFSLPLTKDACSTSEGKLKMVFGKQKNAPRKNDMKAKTAKRDSGKPSEAAKPTKERNTASKPATKPALFSTNSQNEKSLPKRKRAPTASSKPKKRARGGEDEVSSVFSRRGGEGERVCSNVSSSVGPVWAQCEKTSCQKWRKLRDCSDPLSLPDSWTCSMNTDPERSTCSAEEENWSEDVGDSQEFVETPFVPGSLVWAKMDGYPWWPAMVEEDPNDEAYYQLGKWSTSKVPVRYHVVFFDTPVSRGWVSSFNIHPYSTESDHNITTGASVTQKLRRGLKVAKKQASQASTMTITARLKEFSFSMRFHQMSSKKRKATHSIEEDDMEVYSSGTKHTTKYPKTLSSRTSGRKSARLDRGVAQGDGEEGERVGVREGGCGGISRDEAEVNMEECMVRGDDVKGSKENDVQQ